MTEPAAPPVKGYKPITPAMSELANEGKELEERMLRYLEKVGQKLVDGTIVGGDPRFLAIARTEMQKGWMFAIRAIFNPDRIKLPEDQP